MNSLVVIVALQLQLLVLVLGLLCGGGVAAAAPQDLVNNLFSHSIPLSVPPPVNLVSEFRNWYFESDNLVLLLKTSAGEEGVSQRPAILITLHLDHPLALTSSGATDAAILVKSILDFLKDNHPSSVTAADLLFVFTRGDCIDSSVLLGSVAASRHPLFKNVIAFINVSAFGTFGETDKIVLHQANR